MTAGLVPLSSSASGLLPLAFSASGLVPLQVFGQAAKYRPSAPTGWKSAGRRGGPDPQSSFGTRAKGMA